MQHNDAGEQAFQDLVSELAFYCPGALPSVVQRVVMRAIRQFARETCIFQTSLQPDVQVGVATYELSDLVPDGYDIMQIEQVSWCGQCIDHVRKCTKCRREMCVGCGTVKFEMKAADCIQLHPCPSGPIPEPGLEVQAILCPDYDLCSLPSEIKKYSDTIMLLAEGLMMKLPKQKWSNPRIGEAKRREAMGDLIEIRCDVSNSFTNEQPKVGERVI